MAKKHEEKRKRIFVVKTIEDLVPVEIGNTVSVHAMEIAFDMGYSLMASRGVLLEKNLKERNFSYLRCNEFRAETVSCMPIKNTEYMKEVIDDAEIARRENGGYEEYVKYVKEYASKGGLYNYCTIELEGEKLKEIKKKIKRI